MGWVGSVASVVKDVAPLVQAGATAYAANQTRKAAEAASKPIDAPSQIAPLPTPVAAAKETQASALQGAKDSVSGVGQASGQSGNAQTFLTGAGGITGDLPIARPTVGGDSAGASNTLLSDAKKKAKTAATTLFGG